MKKILLPVALIAACWLGAARASVLFEIAGGSLKDASGGKVANGNGLLVLVASTADETFTLPTSDTVFAAGKTVTAVSDDVILSVTPIEGDGDADGAAAAGEFRRAVNVQAGAAVPAGSLLRMYWFPTLSAATPVAVAGTAFGAYRSESDALDADASDAWILPADGTTGHTLIFRTSDTGSAVNTAATGTSYGIPELQVQVGNGSVPSAVDVVASSDAATTTSTETPTPTPAARTVTTGATASDLAARLAALRKQIAGAKRIKDPDRRKRKIAALRARIEALLETTQPTN